ncbi:VanZ family protein [Marinicauda pacifica]|uniref:VanZ family protein n=1 Tax=Marinicauda pacifica TaxID=1133559 RepID=UPI0035C86CAB
MSQDGGSSKNALGGLNHRRELRLAFLLVLVLVTALALRPGAPGHTSFLGWDKLDHISAFGALALLARMGWPQWRWIYPAIALAGYGLLIELVQASPLIHRTASVADLVADAIGIALGMALAFGIERAMRLFNR